MILAYCNFCKKKTIIFDKFPVKLFDYMSFGKAVVSTDLPEISKIIRREKIGLVYDGTFEDLAEKIILLLRDKKRLKLAQVNSLRAIRDRYSWAHRAKELHKLITSYV